MFSISTPQQIFLLRKWYENQNLEKISAQMGISIEQMAHLLAQKDKKPEEQVASSSSMPPPPPPPPAARMERSRSQKKTPEEIEVPATRQPSAASTTDYRSRSQRKEPVAIPINTPREPSAATGRARASAR